MLVSAAIPARKPRRQLKEKAQRDEERTEDEAPSMQGVANVVRLEEKSVYKMLTSDWKLFTAIKTTLKDN
jgi:hypothetical protein